MSYRPLTRDRYLSDDELAAFMDTVRHRRHVNAPRDLAFFALLANTGIRPAEALALTVADMHLGARPPWIRVVRLKKRATLPTVDELCVPDAVAGPLLEYIGAAELRAGPLFPFHRRTAGHLFKLYSERAGIHGQRLYSLRHTAATRLHRLTRDIGLVQRLLGHDSPETSALYVHIGRDQQREAVAAMGAIT
jgi:integrase